MKLVRMVRIIMPQVRIRPRKVTTMMYSVACKKRVVAVVAKPRLSMTQLRF